MQQLIWTLNWLQPFIQQPGEVILAAALCALTLLSASLAIFFSGRLRAVSLKQRRLAQAMEAQALLLEKFKNYVEDKMNSLPAHLLPTALGKDNSGLQVALMREELASLRTDLIAEQAAKRSPGGELAIS